MRDLKNVYLNRCISILNMSFIHGIRLLEKELAAKI